MIYTFKPKFFASLRSFFILLLAFNGQVTRPLSVQYIDGWMDGKMGHEETLTAPGAHIRGL